MPSVSRPYSLDNFFKIVTDPNGKDILDPYTFLWTDFPYFLRNSQGLALRIDASLEGVPDLISWDNYGTHDLWWVVCIANEMVTPDVEITPGINMFVPSSADISNFNSQTKARLRQGRLVSLRPGNFIPQSTSQAQAQAPALFTLGQSKLGAGVLG